MVHKTNFGTWDSKTIIPLEACLKDSFYFFSSFGTHNGEPRLVTGRRRLQQARQRYGEKSEVMNYKEAKVIRLKVSVQRREAKVHNLKRLEE